MKHHILVKGFLCLAVYNLLSGGVSAFADVHKPNSINDWTPIMFQMETPSAGWAVVNGRTQLVHTVDSGRYWRDISPVHLSGDGDLLISGVYYLNSDTAWLIVSTNNFKGFYGKQTVRIYHTSDAGQHWSQSSINVPTKQKAGIMHLDFVNANNGWLMMGLDTRNSYEQGSVAIYHTRDGGNHWLPVSSTGTHDYAKSQNGLPILPFKTGIKFTSNQIGWATVGHSDPWLYRTTDGGKTWHAVSVSINDVYKNRGSSPYPPVFFTPNHAILPIYYFVSIDGQTYIKNVLFVTEDGGRSWKQSTPVQYVLSQEGRFGGSTDLVSPTDAFVIGGTRLFYTHDGGNSWASLQLPKNVFRLQFVSRSMGYAIGSDGLQETQDGGRTWRLINAHVQ